MSTLMYKNRPCGTRTRASNRWTKDELHIEARKQNIDTKMTMDQICAALIKLDQSIPTGQIKEPSPLLKVTYKSLTNQQESERKRKQQLEAEKKRIIQEAEKKQKQLQEAEKKRLIQETERKQKQLQETETKATGSRKETNNSRSRKETNNPRS